MPDLDLHATLGPRQDRGRADLGRRAVGEGPGGQPAIVGRVVADPAMATATGRYYAVHPVSVLGIEAEGGAGDLVEDPSMTIYVDVIGSRAPAVGDDLVCRFVENRWVAERFGRQSSAGGTASIPGCVCTLIPPSLHMSASGPCVAGAFPTCDLVYGPTPPELAGLDLGPNCFLSTQVFEDPYVFASYRLHLGCDSVFFRLSRVYLPGPDTNAFHDAPLYTWSIGRAGNTCSPFLLSVGIIFSGGNPNCTVVVSE